MNRTRILITLALLSALLPAGARGDTDAILSSATDQVTWQEGPLNGTTGLAPVPEACALNDCGEFGFTVSLPEGVWSSPGGVQVSIRWENENHDLDLYVYGPGGDLAAKSEGPVSTGESVLLRSAINGDYRVLVSTTSAEDTSYEGTAEVEYLPAVHPVREMKPDLISLPSRNVGFETSAVLFDLPVPSTPSGCYAEETAEQGATKCLRFDQVIANVGHGPFELRYRADGIAMEETRDLVQRIYSSDGTWRDRFADTYTFHATHAHFHYQNFAQSHLWRATPDGEKVDDAPVRSGRKNGFCMVDVEHANFGARGDAARTYIPPACLVPTELVPETGAFSAISGISVGWADVYNWFLPDQFIDVAGLPDGYYILENVADQAGTVEELRDDNNSVETLIRICGYEAEIVGVDTNC